MPLIKRDDLTRFQDLDDVNFSPGSGTDGRAIFYDDASGKFTGDDGLTYDGSADELVATGGIISPIMKPESDSTSAVRIQDSSGLTDVLTLDTTNDRIGINDSTPSSTLTVQGDSLETYCTTFRQSKATMLLSIENEQTSSTSNSSGFDFRAESSTQTRTMGRLSGGWADNTDATRTSFFKIATSDNAAFADRFVFEGDSMFIGSNTSPTANLDVVAGSTDKSQMRLRSGVAPTSPNDGDIWFDGTDLHIRIGGTTYTLDKTSV